MTGATTPKGGPALGPDRPRARRRPPAPGLDPAPLLARFPGTSDVQVARITGVSTTAVLRWRRGQRRLRLSTAERIAAALRLDPWDIWPELRERAIAAHLRRCARPRCTTEFLPRRSDQRYCTTRCRKVEASRRYEARKRANPETRQRLLDKNRRYHRECAAALAARRDRRAA